MFRKAFSRRFADRQNRLNRCFRLRSKRLKRRRSFLNRRFLALNLISLSVPSREADEIGLIGWRVGFPQSGLAHLDRKS